MKLDWATRGMMSIASAGDVTYFITRCRSDGMFQATAALPTVSPWDMGVALIYPAGADRSISSPFPKFPTLEEAMTACEVDAESRCG